MARFRNGVYLVGGMPLVAGPHTLVAEARLADVQWDSTSDSHTVSKFDEDGGGPRVFNLQINAREAVLVLKYV